MKKIFLSIIFFISPLSVFADTTYTFSGSDVKAPFFDSLVSGGPFEDLNIWYDDTYISLDTFGVQLCELYQYYYSFSGTLLSNTIAYNYPAYIDAYIYDSSGFSFTGSVYYDLVEVSCITDYTIPSWGTNTGTIIVNVNSGISESVFKKEELYDIYFFIGGVGVVVLVVVFFLRLIYFPVGSLGVSRYLSHNGFFLGKK